MKSKLDEGISETYYEEKQLEEFSKLDLSGKIEKLFPEGNCYFEQFIQHHGISEEIKHKGLYNVMLMFLEGDGITQPCHWMMYNLGLETIYKKEFARYDFSEFDAFDDDFFEEACARGAVYQIIA